MNQTIQTILNRKSVRRYTGQRVSSDDMLILVDAGMAAPCSYGKCCWYFVIVDDDSVLAMLAAGLPNASMITSAGQAIVVMADINLAHGGVDVPYWIQDCSAAVENILISAEAMGLGACWTGVCPRDERMSFVRQVLGAPENIFPFGVIAVGHSTGEDQPKDKFDSSRIFWNSWVGKKQI